jgi:hypothetical protein
VRPCLEALEDRITPTTFTPTTFADDGAANSLRGAISAANADKGTATDTIQLQEGTYQLTIPNTAGHDTVNLQGDLNIISARHALVIQGATDASGNPETVIEQAVADRVFQIVNQEGSPGSSVTFKNLVIEGGIAQDQGGSGTAAGSATAEGGGILDDAGNVTLTNVELRDNEAKAGTGLGAFGGGIYVGNGGALTVQSSTIQNNSALGGTGNTDATNQNGGNAEGGGVYASGPTAITDSVLSDNVVTGGNASTGTGVGGGANGGGIYALGPTTITSSTLSGNTVTGGSSSVSGGGSAEGGGVYFGSFGTQDTATLTRCTVTGNTLNGGTGSLTNNIIFIRGTGGDPVSPDIFEGSVGGSALGGGVFANGRITISASDLSVNTLTGGQGTLDSTSISGDVGGEAEGGGVFAIDPVTLTTSLLSGNRVTGGAGDNIDGTPGGSVGGTAAGGGVYAGTATITASTLSDNIVAGGSGSASAAAAEPGNAEGGGAYLGGGSIALVNSTIADNLAIGGQGTAINPAASGGGLLFGVTAAATLTNVTVAGNTAALPSGVQGGTSGGGIAITGDTVTLVNTLVALNGATSGPDVAGFAGTGSGHNLIGEADGSSGFSAAHGDLLGGTANPLNPRLGPLQNNGGPTPTMAIALDSPAFNAGDDNAETVTGPFDQRGQGFARVARGAIDIGAYEVQPTLIHFPPPGLPVLPPTLRVPFLLALFDQLLHGVETGNGKGIWTMTDSLLGIPLLVSNYDSAGNLMNVHLLGINVTPLFELS